MVRACAELMVPRTLAIDEAITSDPPAQLVILGAGLDGRAWRLPGLSPTVVFEVDHPASQTDKRQRVGDRAPLARQLHFVAVDFTRDRLGDRLVAAGFGRELPTTWVWEGVVPYLTRREVSATVAAIDSASRPRAIG